MTSGDAVDVIWFVGAFALVLSAFAARRVPMGEAVRMALIWILIFGASFLVIWGWQSVRS
jgi:hypothetical protein